MTNYNKNAAHQAHRISNTSITDLIHAHTNTNTNPMRLDDEKLQ